MAFDFATVCFRPQSSMNVSSLNLNFLLNQTFQVESNSETDFGNLVSETGQDFFAGVYDNTGLKMVAAVTYIFAGLSYFALFQVASFERSGEAGHYRTLVNQLMSFNIDAVRNLTIALTFSLNHIHSFSWSYSFWVQSHSILRALSLVHYQDPFVNSILR